MGTELVRIEAGEVLFEEGSVGERMYLVLEGRLEVSRMRDGERVVLAVLTPGSMFGEHGLLRQAPRSATVTAAEDSTLEGIDRAALTERVRADPLFALALLEHLSRVTHRMADDYLARAGEDEAALHHVVEIEFNSAHDA